MLPGCNRKLRNFHCKILEARSQKRQRQASAQRKKLTVFIPRNTSLG